MKLINRFFIFAFILPAFYVGGAGAEIACLTEIGKDNETFIQPLKDIVKDSNIIADQTKFQEFINKNKSKFYGLIAGNVELRCMGENFNDLNEIADSESIKIPFEMNGNKYDITVDSMRLFDYMAIPTALLVVNTRNKNPGDVIEKSKMPKDYFFSQACSDHHVRVNLNNKASVNRAGQTAFGTYGGSDSEFFLDMPVGKSCRAFPGLVLGDFGGLGAKEKIVAYENYREGRKALKTFAKALQNTSCGNQGLAVYQVSIDTIPVEKNGKKGWAIAAGVSGGSMAYMGITSGLATLGVGGKIIASGVWTASKLGLITTAAGGAVTVGAINSWNVVGWVILGVTAATAATIALLPKDLADIDQVMVMSEPEIIR